MRLLLTGATGFIGRHVLALPLPADGTIHALSSRPISSRGMLFSHPQVHGHQVDLRDHAAVATLVADLSPTHLLHLAWDLSGNFYTAEANVAWIEHSMHLLRAFQAAGGHRAVLMGTCVEYDVTAGWCVEGQTPLQPHTLYGKSKHALQQQAAAFAEDTRLSLAWLRLFSTYGPGQPVQRLVPAAIDALTAGTVLPVSHGHQIRDYLHVYDIARACRAVVQSTVTGPLNLASGQPVQVADVLQTIGALLHRPHLFDWGANEAPPHDPPCLIGPNQRLREATGWHPLFTLQTGLRQLLNPQP